MPSYKRSFPPKSSRAFWLWLASPWHRRPYSSAMQTQKETKAMCKNCSPECGIKCYQIASGLQQSTRHLHNVTLCFSSSSPFYLTSGVGDHNCFQPSPQGFGCFVFVFCCIDKWGMSLWSGIELFFYNRLLGLIRSGDSSCCRMCRCAQAHQLVGIQQCLSACQLASPTSSLVAWAEPTRTAPMLPFESCVVAF
eukprot:2580236-Amphidinium_carterae.1